tara:strand:+ start:1871 stop:2290 length:420 start_codon:yes stop_codon:yes gene_type:complete
MFSNKFNPDVVNNFKTNVNNRSNSKYELKNIPYKLIINEEKKEIKTSEDLAVNSRIESKNIEDEYKSILKERNIKIKDKKIKNKFNLEEISIDKEYIDDFIDIKKNFQSEFENTKHEIKKDREKFNSILDSLLSDGLLD